MFLLHYGVPLILVICYGCSGDVAPENTGVTSFSNSNSTLQMATPSDNPLNTGDARAFPHAEEVWQKFNSEQRYRLANSADFNFSLEEIKQLLRIYGAQEKERLINDLNNDGITHDFALLLIDKTVRSSNRFGLVIFNQPTDDGAIVSPFWVLKDQDLSRAALGFSRDGLSLNIYGNGGKNIVYQIIWSESSQSYTINPKF